MSTLPNNSGESSDTNYEVLCSQLRSQISSLYDQRQTIADDLRNHDIQTSTKVREFNQREQKAVEYSKQRVDILTKNLKQKRNNDASLSSSLRDQQANNASLAAQMRQELQTLIDEEQTRNQRILNLEYEIKNIQTRISNQASNYEYVLRQIAEVKTDFGTKEEELAKELAMLITERDTATSAITQTSEAEAAKSMSNWDTTIQTTIEEIRNKCEEEINDSDKIVVEELNRYAAASRLRAKGVATELADLMSKEYEGLLASQLANYEGQKNANNIAAAHAHSEVERLTALLHAIRNGRDPGDDVSHLATAFPLLPMSTTNGSSASTSTNPLSPGSPGNGTKGKNSSPLTSTSLPNGIVSPRTTSTATTVRRGSTGALLRSPLHTTTNHRSSSAEPSPRSRAKPSIHDDASINSAPNTISNNNTTSLGSSGVSSSSSTVPSSVLSADILTVLESRDAASLNVNVSRAKRELHQLMERTLARWVRLGSTKGRISDLLAFVRATQAVVASGSEPVSLSSSVTPDNNQHHIVRKDHSNTTGINIAEAYLTEADRLIAKSDIEELRKRLLSLRASRTDLLTRGNPSTATTVSTTSPTKADNVRTIASIDTAIKDTERTLQNALTNYQQRYHESP